MYNKRYNDTIPFGATYTSIDWYKYITTLKFSF